MQAVPSSEQMIAIVAHDLRNPLSAIRSLSRGVLRRSDLPEPLRGRLEQIEGAAARALEMIGSLLVFSESRCARGIALAPVRVDLLPVCRAVLEEVGAAHPGRRIVLAAEGNCCCRCDPGRLAEVVSNLVCNAVVHGAPDGPVQVRLAGGDREVTLTVTNLGPSISPERMPALFEPFQGGRARGLGLGLYIVREIVTAHGGTVDAESHPTRGTSFRVRVPRGQTSCI
jgi:signal transduction histidine kinase